jgi:hypothetical protein
MTLLQNYAGDRQKSSKIMIMKMFVIMDKAKLSIGNINGLNLAAIRLTIVSVSELPQYNITMISCTKSGLMKACKLVICV